MSFLSDWDDILDSLEAQRKKYGGTSIGASAAGAAGGKGFRFPDEDAANKMIKRFETRAESIEKRQVLIEKAKTALRREFSADEVSHSYVQKAMASLDALEELNKSAFEYAKNYARKIEAVKDAKHRTEGGIGGVFSKVGEAVT
jgi:hypothetical protein